MWRGPETERWPRGGIPRSREALQVAWFQSQVFIVARMAVLSFAERSARPRVIAGAFINVEFANPLHREVRPGMIGSGPSNFRKHVSPAPSERDGVVAAHPGFMRLERIADDHAVVTAHDVSEGVRSLVAADPMNDGARSREAPHLPWLIALPIEPRPARLVESDHGLHASSRAKGAFDADSRRRASAFS